MAALCRSAEKESDGAGNEDPHAYGDGCLASFYILCFIFSKLIRL